MTAPVAWKNRIIGNDVVQADQLLANPMNWRIHPKAQQSALESVLDGVGWVQEIVVNQRTGHVVDGHLRVALAISRDEAVPVKYVDLSEDEESLILASLDPLSAMAVTDREMLEDILADLRTSELVQDDARLDALLHEIAAGANVAYGEFAEPGDDPGAQMDRAEELREKWQTERGQVWDVPSVTVPGRSHRVMCGDSTSAEVDIDIDLTLTDPPYGISVVKVDGATDGGSKPVTIGAVRARRPYPFGGVKNRGTVGSANMVDATPYRPVYGDDKPFDPQWLLGGGSNQIIFGGNYFASKLPDSRCWIVWDKNNTGNFADAELAWTSFDKSVKLYKFTWNGLVREGDRDVEGIKRVHPTQKPVGLFRQILDDFSEAGAIIFDPYLGSGTTLIACEQSGRVGVGCEIDPAYVAVTLERLAGMGLEPRLINET